MKMSVLPHVSTDQRKEYGLKVNDELRGVLDLSKFDHFKEGKVGSVSWKWIHLPMKTQGKELNKLVVQNNSTEECRISLLVKYEIGDTSAPIVYYSPSKEALIVHDGESYRLIGGISGQGKITKYSTLSINVADWETGIPLQYKPITKQSGGWGIEFQLFLEGKESSYIYEWDFTSAKLQDLEELHIQYQELLGKK